MFGAFWKAAPGIAASPGAPTCRHDLPAAQGWAQLFLSGGQVAPWVQLVSSEFLQNPYDMEVSLPETS